MVFFFRVDIPDIGLVSLSGENILHCLKRSYHGVIDIVVPMLSITSYTVQIRNGIQTVSYTHLDVYKRQAQTFPGTYPDLFSAIFSYANNPFRI